jgi:hypothetical protein
MRNNPIARFISKHRLAVTLLLIMATVASSEDSSKLYQAFDFVRGFLHYKPTDTTSTKKGLRVIGAGFARTGTKSTEKALHMLEHKIYDTRSMLEHGLHVPLWIQGAKDWKESKDLTVISKLLEEIEEEGYTATLDFPMNLFAIQLAQLRPGAKVLMTVRDDEEKWFQSWKAINEIMSHLACRPWKWIVGDLGFTETLLNILENFDFPQAAYPDEIDRPLPWYEEMHTFPSLDDDEAMENWIQLHKRYQKRLTMDLAENRFLVFNVKQGWSPLLKFLDIDEEEFAQQDFPNLNDRKSLETVRKIMDFIAMAGPFLLGGSFLLMISIMKRLCFGGRRTATETKKIQ